MDNATDRANRASWQQFSLNSILLMTTAGIFFNLVTIGLIAFAGDSIHLPLTIMVVLVNLLLGAGTIDGIGDFQAILSDYDEGEQKTNLSRRFNETPTIFFKALLGLIFGATALSQLYVIYFGNFSP